MSEAAPARTKGSWQHHVVSAFTQRLGLKATALLLAIVLWFVVNAKEPQQALVPVRFVPTLDSTLVLRESPQPLQALVAGSPKELIKLNSTPLVVRRQINAESPDTLVLDLRPDDVIVPDGVDAVVQQISPSSVTLRFETTWSRKVPIRSLIDVSGLTSPIPIVTRFEPESVQVSGPRHLVMQVPAVRTVHTTIAFPDSLPHLVDIDTTGLGSALRIRPAQVKAQLVVSIKR